MTRASILCATALTFLVTACTERGILREDKIATEGGNAHATNAAKMAVDMTPRVARNRRIDVNGNRLNRAHKKYEANKSGSEDQSTGSTQNADQGDQNLVDDL